MAKYIVGAIALILIALAGYYAWQYNAAPAASPPEAPQFFWTTYATSTFSISYPNNLAVNENYTYTQFPGKPIAGVSFVVPASGVEGTNLSADSYISVEWLPRAKNCTGEIFLVPEVKVVELSTGTTTYSVATTTGAAAGNFYEEHVYAVKSSKPCTAIRYYLHFTNISNYEPGTVREFDRTTVLESWDAIRDSLVLMRQ